VILCLAVGGGLAISGCTRCFYRKNADEEVSEVLAQKDKYPAWKIENWHVYADPRARFADPTPPDCPPKPPDDPAAYDLSPNPQKPGKAGFARIEGTGYLELIARWDKENRAKLAQEEAEEEKGAVAPRAVGEGKAGQEEQEGPEVLGAEADAAKSGKNGTTTNGTRPRDVIAEVKSNSLLDVSGKPAYLLTLDQAAELAMFNSRQYQDQREDLYLAALPVTQERFSFMAQYFAVEQAIRQGSGKLAPEGATNSWALNSGTGLAKVLPTGALLLLNFSNQTVFNFLNPKNTSSVTTLDFTAIQPLLRGGGFAVALEPLTLAERNLLYAIRNYARFRKELYVAVASNNGGSISGSTFQPTGVLAGGGVIGNAGLGASGVQPGVIPPFSTTINSPLVPPLSPGSLNLTPALSPPPSGYLNTMLQKIQVYIDQENIDVLTSILERFRGLLEGDVVGPLQVQSVEQQLLGGRSTLLTDQSQYLQALDSFKLTIGVPMQLSIQMEDSVLRPLLKQFRRARAITENEQAAVAEASALIDLAKAPRLRSELLRLFQQSALVKGTSFAGSIRGRWAQWEKLSNVELNTRLNDLRDEAKKLLDLQADLQKKGEKLSEAEQARLDVVNNLLDLGNFERALRVYEASWVGMGQPKQPDAAGERQRIRQFQNVISAWQKVLVAARDEQWAEVRATWPSLPRCCVDGVDLIRVDLTRAQAAAAQHAFENRLDLMNIRAQLVDTWRQIAIYANTLLSIFNVRYHLSANSPLVGPQPTNIGGSGTTHQLILNADLPLTRISERNNYRASLIAFQRQRRTLQQAEDLAAQAVRNELYLLRLYADQYKLQQRQLELAYLTIDSSLESLQAPPAPPAPAGQTASRAAADGPAALTQQLLAAQRSLPTAQNGLLTVWINYLDARLQLYRDLELMPLDARGVWIDEVTDCDCGGSGKETTKADAQATKSPRTEEQLPEPRKVTPGGQKEVLPQPRKLAPMSGPELR
jgi:hypothetical protein